jgi:ribosomal-protein-alanine N-acetyltransferase
MQKIRKLTRKNIENIYNISVQQFGSESWSLDQFKDCLKNKNYITYVILEEETPTGFLIAQDLIDSINLLLIAIESKHKNKGFASQLLAKLIKLSKEKKQKIWLEVKETNLSAINLYKKFGFQNLYERKKYYKDGHSALILEKSPS